MTDILEYYVMQHDGTLRGVTMWLAADEKSWTKDFQDAAAFTSSKLADDIAKRQCADEQTYYVMACMGTETDDE